MHNFMLHLYVTLSVCIFAVRPSFRMYECLMYVCLSVTFLFIPSNFFHPTSNVLLLTSVLFSGVYACVRACTSDVCMHMNCLSVLVFILQSSFHLYVFKHTHFAVAVPMSVLCLFMCPSVHL